MFTSFHLLFFAILFQTTQSGTHESKFYGNTGNFQCFFCRCPQKVHEIPYNDDETKLPKQLANHKIGRTKRYQVKERVPWSILFWRIYTVIVLSFPYDTIFVIPNISNICTKISVQSKTAHKQLLAAVNFFNKETISPVSVKFIQSVKLKWKLTFTLIVI